MQYLDEDEADIIEAFRQLSDADQTRLLWAVDLLRSASDLSLDNFKAAVAVPAGGDVSKTRHRIEAAVVYLERRAAH